MSFINEESGICLSPTGETVLAGCDYIINENGLSYINTEYPKRILPEGGCKPITEFNCGDIDRVTVDSGKFVTIINTCTLPLTITGFKNSNPERFSVFKYPDYSGFSEYTTGNTEELPITIEPYQRINIDTFFHPLYSELLSGNAGTLDGRSGDKFESTFDILPGFEIINCKEDPITSILWWEENQDCDLVLSSKAIKSSNPAMQLFEESGNDSYVVRDEAYFSTTEDAQYFEQKNPEDVVVKFSSNATSSYCSASFKLEGELICYPIDKQWMLNTGNFIEPDLSTLATIQNQFFLNKKKTLEINTSDEVSVPNIFVGLRDVSLAYASMLENMSPDWYESYGNLAISGSLGVFNSLINQLIQAGQDNNIDNLLQSSLAPTNVSYDNKTIQVSYESNNSEVIEIDGSSWTGMQIKTDPIEDAGDLYNQTVFFNAEIVPGPQKDARMFIVDSGDYNAYPMKEVL
jgi:hypothetical protein